MQDQQHRYKLSMNESQTRIDKIDPALHAVGWGKVEDSRIITEYKITNGRISKTSKPNPLKADYILSYKGVKLAVVEAKSDEKDVSDGVGQAKQYAEMLNIRYTYSTNGDALYAIDMQTGEEGEIDAFPTPDELWAMTFGDADEWRDKFYAQPLFSNGTKEPRYYQEIAINKTLNAIAKDRKRILLTLATGTGKTYIAFQICYKLFNARWNIKKTGNRPRVLFLADRNILANQAFNGFFGFAQDALVRITPDGVRKGGKVPTNGSIFFTIFQTFMTDDGKKYTFGEYPRDFFDLVIIDECHRGGANDESSWREIMEYFAPAVQIGLTATPRRDVNADTYKYFGDPVYTYSLKQGIADGYLTPFRHCKMQGTLDDYIYTPEDEILSGEVEEGKVYTEEDFYNGNIRIKQRDLSRVKEFMKYIGEDEKTLVFCSTQNHAGQVRDMINQVHKGNPRYAVRVTANDGLEGERQLKEFQDNEKTIPTILTTSQKLSTGVDALNIRNIVLMRPIHSMIEFKQIIGRGTRLYDSKYYFTIYDFVKAYENFQDPSWDGDPEVETNDFVDSLGPIKDVSAELRDHPRPPYGHRICPKCGQTPCVCEKTDKLEIRLSDGRTRKIKYLKSDMFWGAAGKPVSAEEFLKAMFGQMPEFFTSVEDLQEKWSTPKTRDALLRKMDEAGYGKDVLKQVRTLIDAENSDLLDVLEYISFNIEPIERTVRVKKVERYRATLDDKERDFVNFIINLYIKEGVEELSADKLPTIVAMKYGSISDGMKVLGGVDVAKKAFLNFQRNLYIN
ncbi:MAG: DEAD/DEAH box helicase family protein [Candidatus Cryptobacteroides sp.]|nr:DEAD/DEAH box helicase family protein [Candidatus Cryptobacteroides sp.]